MEESTMIIISCTIDTNDSEDSIKEHIAVSGYSGVDYYINIVNERDWVKGTNIDQLRSNLIEHLKKMHPVIAIRIVPNTPEVSEQMRELIDKLRYPPTQNNDLS